MDIPDDEIIRALAEELMGWTYLTFEQVRTTTCPPAEGACYEVASVGSKRLWYFGPPTDGNEMADNYPWNPFPDEVDAASVRDKMATMFDVEIFSRDQEWCCQAFLRDDQSAVGNAHVKECTPDAYRKAICLCGFHIVQAKRALLTRELP